VMVPPGCIGHSIGYVVTATHDYSLNQTVTLKSSVWKVHDLLSGLNPENLDSLLPHLPRRKVEIPDLEGAYWETQVENYVFPWSLNLGLSLSTTLFMLVVVMVILFCCKGKIAQCLSPRDPPPPPRPDSSYFPLDGRPRRMSVDIPPGFFDEKLDHLMQDAPPRYATPRSSIRLPVVVSPPEVPLVLHSFMTPQVTRRNQSRPRSGSFGKLTDSVAQAANELRKGASALKKSAESLVIKGLKEVSVKKVQYSDLPAL
jgi:hypothetical protein